MIVIIGLVVLVYAVIVGVTGVFANGGSDHALTDNFGIAPQPRHGRPKPQRLPQPAGAACR
jgi:hypothetical protein